jgi:hypothetical protein
MQNDTLSSNPFITRFIEAGKDVIVVKKVDSHNLSGWYVPVDFPSFLPRVSSTHREDIYITFCINQDNGDISFLNSHLNDDDITGTGDFNSHCKRVLSQFVYAFRNAQTDKKWCYGHIALTPDYKDIPGLDTRKIIFWMAVSGRENIQNIPF